MDCYFNFGCYVFLQAWMHNADLLIILKKWLHKVYCLSLKQQFTSLALMILLSVLTINCFLELPIMLIFLSVSTEVPIILILLNVLGNRYTAAYNSLSCWLFTECLRQHIHCFLQLPILLILFYILTDTLLLKSCYIDFIK